jgi:hypothetical protein
MLKKSNTNQTKSFQKINPPNQNAELNEKEIRNAEPIELEAKYWREKREK